jgi:hypothetical protein
MSSPALVLIEALFNWKMISIMELLGCIFGIYGAFIITMPDIAMNLCFKCCRIRINKKILDEKNDVL